MAIYSVLHIGKTGGTALRFLIAMHLEKNPEAAIDVLPHEITFPQVLVSRPDSKIVFFVRDPVARFVSGFNSRRRKGQPRYNSPWSKEEACAFARFPTANSLGEALTPQHDLFEDAVYAMKAIYHARLGLSHYLESIAFLERNRKHIFFIGTTEHFSSDVEVLKRLLGMDPTLLPPTDSVAAHRSPPDCDRFMSGSATANLRRWYEKDYEIYSWCLKERKRILGGSPHGGA